MTKKNKKKTAREKRILVGAFLTAVVIAAGSTFAWFTSTDTVTNRLSANADYNVKIVESFAPPENWMPGEKVDKDVYAVNTGNIEAFAKATISGMMSITREVPVAVPGAIYTDPQPAGDDTWYEYGNGGWGDPLLNAPTATKIDGDVLVGGGTVDGPTVPTVIYEDEDEEGNITNVQEGVHDLMYVATGTGVTFYYRAGNSVIYTSAGGDAPWVGTGLDDYPDGAKSYTGGTVSYGTPATNIPTDATHYIVNGDNVIWYKAVNETATGGWDFTGENENSDGVYNCVELTENQVYAIEAGAFLAWAPTEDNVNNTLGNKAIGFKEQNEKAGTVKYEKKTTDSEGQEIWVAVTETEYNAHSGDATFSDVYRKNDDKDAPTNYLKTDFKPHADGLYVFRRQIVVNGDENSHAAGTETFKYEGYYFLGGKYYKVMNINVTPDDSTSKDGQYLDVAGDGTTKDGRLKGATAYLVKEEKQYIEQPDSFEYDSIHNRIVATYNTDTESKITGDDTTLVALAAELDKAEHDLAQAEQRLERTLEDQGIVNDAVREKSKIVDDASLAYKNALKAYNEAVTAYENARSEYSSGKADFVPARKAALDALKALAGEGGSVTGTSDKADIENDTPEREGKTLTNNGVTISSPTDGAANVYSKALWAYNHWSDDLLAGTDREDHIIYAYLVELSKDSTNYGEANYNGNQYKLPDEWANKEPEEIGLDALKAELIRAARKCIIYDYADDHLEWDSTPYEDNSNLSAREQQELHQFNRLFMSLKVAEKDYNDKLDAYNIAIANLNVAINALGPNDDFKAIETTGSELTVVDKDLLEALNAWKSNDAAAVKTAYNALTGSDSTQEDTVVDNFTPKTEEQIQAIADGSALGGKEKNLWDAWQELVDAKNKLKAVEDTTYIDPATGLPYGQPVHMDGDSEVANNKDDDPVSVNLKAAWDNYYEKRNAKDEAERKLLAAQDGFTKKGDLKIYIYLKNVSITGEAAKQWQLLPTTLAEKKATFYYTSILAAGEVSEQLIDYVELDESANQEMYKTFDYDLNITLDSAQVTYADDAATLRTADAAEDAFSWKEIVKDTNGTTTEKMHNITGHIQDPTVAPNAQNNTTVVSWSDSAANVKSGDELGN